MPIYPRSVSSRLGRFAGLNVARHLWLSLLSLVATPVLYHGLGAGAYGILALVNLLTSQLAVLEFGFGHATIRWLSRARSLDDQEAIGRILSTSLWVFVAAAVVGAVIIVGLHEYLVEEFFRIPHELLETARVAILVAAVFFVAVVLGNLAGAVWQGSQRFGFLNLITGVGSTIQILGSLCLVMLGLSVIHVIVWSTALGIGLLGVHLWGFRREISLEGLKVCPDGKTLREMASFGVLLMLAGLFSQVYLTAGPLVLGHFVLVSALPFFTVPFGIFQRLYRLASGVSSALFPVVAELDGVKDHRTLDRVFLSGTRVLLLAGLATGLPAVLLAGPFLDLWMGKAFAVEATPVLERLFLAYVITLATVPSVELARGRGRAGRVAAHVGILASVNLLGVLLLAPGYGVAGAASAFLAAQTVGSAILFLWVGGRSVLRLLDFRLLTLLGVGLLLTYAGYVSVQALTIRISIAVGTGLFLLFTGFFWVLDSEEQKAMRRSFMGVFSRA